MKHPKREPRVKALEQLRAKYEENERRMMSVIDYQQLEIIRLTRDLESALRVIELKGEERGTHG